MMKKVNCHCQVKKDGCKGRLEAASPTIFDFFESSGQGNFTFIREQSTLNANEMHALYDKHHKLSFSYYFIFDRIMCVC